MYRITAIESVLGERSHATLRIYGEGVPGLAPALYSGGTNEVPPWKVLPVTPLVATCHPLTTQHKSCYFAFPDAAPAHSLAQDGHHQVTLGLT